MKKNIAIVWGGYSSESVVSEKSMLGIQSFIDKNKYNVYSVKIDKSGWTSEIEGATYSIDKNNFSIKYKEYPVKLDFAYITIHGTPGEDGRLQGYLDMLGIPYSNCGVTASAITFNKYICNNYLKNFGLTVANSLILKKYNSYNIDNICEKLKLPLFVKPNVGGSSFATTKVKKAEDLESAISTAFEEADEIIIESFIKGREVTCGCYKIDNNKVLLPITEVITKNEFFDYDAKYKGEVEEITPAKLPSEMTDKIKDLTSSIYDLVDAKGIIRADFIIDNNIPYLLEVNTTPGMTVTSFIPQQAQAANLSMTTILTDIIENELKRYYN